METNNNNFPDGTDIEEASVEAACTGLTLDQIAGVKPTPPSAARASDLLADLLVAFKKPLKGTPAPRAKAAKPEVLPQHVAWNTRKTGYRVWKATGRIIQLEDQYCTCCHTVTSTVKDELFELENTTAHSVWLRHEGFGIENQQDLEIRYVDLPLRHVTACGLCRLPDTDVALLAMFSHSEQLCFPF